MIVRISGEGQYRLADELAAQLNELEGAVGAAVEACDDGAFHSAFDGLMAFVRDNGSEIGEDELEGSDVILPPADLTLAEAAHDFSGEGLIPD